MDDKDILIVGTYSTGKTTLYNKIAPLLPNHYRVPEGARQYIESLGIPVDKMTLEQRRDLQAFQTSYASTAIHTAKQLQKNLLMDSSAVEAAAYSDDLFEQDHIIYRRLNEQLELYAKRAYAVLLLPTIPLEKDGVRNEDHAYRIEIHKKIVRLLGQYDIPHSILLSPDPAGRAMETLGVLTQLPNAA